MATVPFVNFAVPPYPVVLLTVTSRLRATVLHGTAWSLKSNSPSSATTDFTVVTNRLGPGGVVRSRVNFGKLCRPLGQVSTAIFHPVIRTDSTSTSRCASALKSSETSMDLAIRNG